MLVALLLGVLLGAPLLKVPLLRTAINAQTATITVNYGWVDGQVDRSSSACRTLKKATFSSLGRRRETWMSGTHRRLRGSPAVQLIPRRRTLSCSHKVWLGLAWVGASSCSFRQYLIRDVMYLLFESGCYTLLHVSDFSCVVDCAVQSSLDIVRDAGKITKPYY
ncbi:uncharacterized protein K452DRAFT_102037 [Aplosporella prunicola CBS 121167]|uniref:Uncharacterized protein n=1 Tax=Aplosporella prunicola CBS 121167 TaxID=1176127 RepID=A0A6A6B2D6_9PEZI|nr:uncharacterized protein K452DRAFT_102037 [Aplosporella prunicola CBS 121167]KAF2137533.1 hypothetical protein K452DRAFT_102037 [Aplosporella prunicola CBS 121167]